MALRESRRPERTCRIIAALAAAVVLSQPAAQAQGGGPPALSEVRLPGGLGGAREAIGDRGAADRATFLADLIQRFYNTPADPRANTSPQLRALAARLERSGGAAPGGSSADADDLLPLPLTSAWWSDVVFHRQIAPDALALAILHSRGAALLYWALLSLDAPTRTWLAGRPGLVGRLLRDDAAVLVVAAPGVRVADGVMQLPGGARARPAWEAVVGAKATGPDVFLQKLIEADRGQQAYLLNALSQLSDAQLQSTLRLEAADPAERVDALRRLYRVFIRAAWRWQIPARPFWRPPLDPLLLLSELRASADGAVALPGPERFWEAVFNNRPESNEPSSPGERAPSVDLVWLLEQVYGVEPDECRIRTEQVLFASRVFTSLTPEASRDAVVAVSALRTHPALVRTLERLRIRDAAVYRLAVERARALDAIADRETRLRALAQFQGALALVTRAAFTGSLTPDEVPGLVSSLSEVPTSDAGAYDGRLAGWIDDRLRSRVPRPEPRAAAPEPGVFSAEPRAPPGDPSRAAGEDSGVDDDLQRLLAGRASPASGSPGIEWEGTIYRVDLAAAEAVRLERARGDRPAPVLAAAWTLLAVANRLAQGSPAGEALAHEAGVLDRVARAMGWTDESRHDRDSSAQYRQIATELRQANASRGPQAAGRLVALLRRLADDLTASGLTELAYAAALGGPDAGPISAADAALRHDFGHRKKREDGRSTEWRLPVKATAEPGRPAGPWHVEGSLLGLDVCLAERWLRRISSRPLSAPPSIDDLDRRALVEVVAIMQPSSLTDAARDAIAAAIRAGRARLAAAATAADFDAIAGAIPLSPARRTLLPWVFAHDRDRLPSFLSPAELFSLGLGVSGVGRSFDAWGAPAGPRLGCQCLAFPDGRSRDLFMGHWGSGILMGALPDLNLRLAELLAELKMPAALLPSVLAAATLDVVNHAPVSHPDDVRGLLEQVQGLTRDQVEQYLALLTTDGPLVPAEPAVARDAPKERP